ncbi:MAG: 5-oxoprolinase subunit PxpA, partial [Candidatus Nanopelagicales bacterium]
MRRSIAVRVIDLNADLGEGVGDDDALLQIVTSANIATGAHAGGGPVLHRAVTAAVASGVAVGAHPSYRDRAGFGRASRLAALHVDPAARASLAEDLIDQVLTVARLAERAGAPLTHVKAHGSLYNEAVGDPLAARVVLDAMHDLVDRLGYPVAVMSQPHGHLAQLARSASFALVAEGFVDRGYEPSGRLVARGLRGALHDSIAAMVAQALDLAAGMVRAVDGATIDLVVGSMCVHGDTPDAVGAALAVHAALVDAGWQVA